MVAAKKSVAKTPSKVQFKEIRAWKVLLLGVITLGLYFVIWLMLRQRELPNPKPRFSHWGIVVGLSAAFVVLVMTIYIYALVAITDSTMAANFIVWSLYGLGFSYGIAVALWVMQIAKAIHRQLDISMHPFLLFLLAYFLTPVLVVSHQWAINRLGTSQPVALKASTSTWLYRVAVVGVTLGLIANTIYILQHPISETISVVQADHAKIRKELERMYQLTNEYRSCVQDFQAKYPEDKITSENYDESRAAQKKCDDIYAKINAL